MAPTKLRAAAATALMLNAVAGPSLANANMPLRPRAGYFTNKFVLERILDWGTRPAWSPDGRRIVFTRSDQEAGPAYEIDVATRKVRCLTCRWGSAGNVVRIYYLPDGSFLILALPNLLTSEEVRGSTPPAQDLRKTELYWMPASATQPPQPLAALAAGEIALNYSPLPDGRLRIAWGEFSPKPRLLTGDIVHDGTRATLVNRTVWYGYPSADPDSLVTIAETYDFMRNGRALLFFTVEKGRPNNGMYEFDFDSSRMTRLPTDDQHNEAHAFPDTRYALEESNRASDPSSPIRGISGHQKPTIVRLLKAMGKADAEELAERYGGRGFDLYVLDWQTGQRRRLTDVSDIGGEANQSTPARDGRRIAFAMDAPRSGPYAGKGGLYVGTFVTPK